MKLNKNAYTVYKDIYEGVEDVVYVDDAAVFAAVDELDEFVAPLCDKSVEEFRAVDGSWRIGEGIVALMISPFVALQRAGIMKVCDFAIRRDGYDLILFADGHNTPLLRFPLEKLTRVGSLKNLRQFVLDAFRDSGHAVTEMGSLPSPEEVDEFTLYHFNGTVHDGILRDISPAFRRVYDSALARGQLDKLEEVFDAVIERHDFTDLKKEVGETVINQDGATHLLTHFVDVNIDEETKGIRVIQAPVSMTSFDTHLVDGDNPFFRMCRHELAYGDPSYEYERDYYYLDINRLKTFSLQKFALLAMKMVEKELKKIADEVARVYKLKEKE